MVIQLNIHGFIKTHCKGVYFIIIQKANDYLLSINEYHYDYIPTLFI